MEFLLSMLATAFMATEPVDPIRVLAFGQSNMVGRYGPADATPTSRVRAFDPIGRKYNTAELGKSPFSQDRTGRAAANNLAYVFSQALSSYCDRPVDLVLIAADGMRIEYFMPIYILDRYSWQNTQHSSNYGTSASDELLGAGGLAKAGLANGETYDVVLMHQGEGNFSPAADQRAAYALKVDSLFSEFRSRGLTDSDTEILVGEINPRYRFSGHHRDALRLIKDSSISIVPWLGIEDVGTVSGTTDNHATGNGLDRLGLSYFVAYIASQPMACRAS